MKALLLKDLYTIGQSMKQMAFILIFLAFAMIPSTGAAGYIFSITLICSMLTITSFAYDEQCRFPRTALTMPVTRRTVVTAKYAALLIFALGGALLGLMVGAVGEIFTGSRTGLIELLLMAELAFTLGTVVAGATLPLLYRFGAERGRMLMLLAMMIPAGLVAIAYFAVTKLGVTLSDRLVVTLIAASPLLSLAWNAVTHRISCRIFAKQDV